MRFPSGGLDDWFSPVPQRRPSGAAARAFPRGIEDGSDRRGRKNVLVGVAIVAAQQQVALAVVGGNSGVARKAAAFEIRFRGQVRCSRCGPECVVDLSGKARNAERHLSDEAGAPATLRMVLHGRTEQDRSEKAYREDQEHDPELKFLED